MESTGCKDLQRIRKVLQENDNDLDASIEFIIAVGNDEDMPNSNNNGEDDLTAQCIQAVVETIGYPDLDEIRQLVQKHDYDVQAVIEELLNRQQVAEMALSSNKPVTRSSSKQKLKEKPKKEKQAYLTKKQKQAREKDLQEQTAKESKKDIKDKAELDQIKQSIQNASAVRI